ncbi:MAG TPA: GNAT family N-acetyltransferase [Chloroflexota bacterium]|nr:GNAT family N-acetyltransferase [Chloroflexota bacterium]
MAVDVITYDRDWLPQLASLARAHARLVPPWITLRDEDVEWGLQRHAAWPFYTPGLAEGETLLAVDGRELLAAGQVGIVSTGWGYGPAEGDGPEWVHDDHLSLFWVFAWPGWRAAEAGAALLAARVVGRARSQGLPGLEAFRGGPGFLPFGTQLSSHWPHLWAPLRASGFRQPRDLLAYTGETTPEALPAVDGTLDELEFRGRRDRVEAWWQGQPVGVCAASPIGSGSSWRWIGERQPFVDRRLREWAVIRRLVVDRQVRGRGIGSALLAEQLRRLHRRGCTHFLLHVVDDPGDPAAARLYHKFGVLADRQQVLRVSF